MTTVSDYQNVIAFDHIIIDSLSIGEVEPRNRVVINEGGKYGSSNKELGCRSKAKSRKG